MLFIKLCLAFKKVSLMFCVCEVPLLSLCLSLVRMYKTFGTMLVLFLFVCFLGKKFPRERTEGELGALPLCEAKHCFIWGGLLGKIWRQ